MEDNKLDVCISMNLPYENLTVGNVLKYNKDVDSYVFEERIAMDEKEVFYSIKKVVKLSPDYVENLVRAGFASYILEDELEQLKVELRNYKLKLLEIKSFIKNKSEEYKHGLKNVNEEYAEGLMPTCVKVEAETVYNNMEILLNALKDIIDTKKDDE